jgi:hypothetical protein
MIVGYARVSTNDQDLSAQLEALKAAGAQNVWREKISGAKTDRPELAKLVRSCTAEAPTPLSAVHQALVPRTPSASTTKIRSPGIISKTAVSMVILTAAASSPPSAVRRAAV